MIIYLEIVKKIRREFDSFLVVRIPRELNTKADSLAGLGAVFCHINLTHIPIIHIMKPAVERMQDNMDVMALENSSDADPQSTQD